MSGRSKKKLQNRAKMAKTKLAEQPSLRAATVRTELSPYNRDYVEALPATVHNVRTTHRESTPVKMVKAASLSPSPKAAVIAKTAQILQSAKFVAKRPISSVARPSASRGRLRSFFIGSAVVLAAIIIGFGALLVQKPDLFPDSLGIKSTSLAMVSRVQSLSWPKASSSELMSKPAKVEEKSRVPAKARLSTTNQTGVKGKAIKIAKMKKLALNHNAAKTSKSIKSKSSRR